MRLDLAKLQVFREVARAGSYTAAARRLHVTTSAVSHAIAKLREGLGLDLVEWRGRRLSLTRAGDDLYQVCQRVFIDLEEAERRMSAEAGVAAIRCVLGSTLEFGPTVLLPRLKPLLQAHPELHLDFHFSNELLEPLLRDDLDLVVDCRQHPHPGLHRDLLFRERYVVVAAPGFLKDHAIRTPLDLGRTPVLSLDRDGAWWNNLTNTLPARRRPVLEHIRVIDNVRGMINGAIAEYGVGLLPKYAVLEELSSGALVALFPRLKLLEDSFSIYQKLTRVERPANKLVARFLLGLDVRDFGDAVAPGD
jgi:DNA-binding transcriptional LysR family regulator